MSDFKDRMDIASIGLEMGGCVAVGYFLGTWVDRSFGSEPWGLVFFLVAGFGAAGKGLLRVVRRARRVTRQPDVPARMLTTDSSGERIR
ncbi:MAG: AtpZ/AtpI family protein [Myxococcota bacterium]